MTNLHPHKILSGSTNTFRRNCRRRLLQQNCFICRANLQRGEVVLCCRCLCLYKCAAIYMKMIPLRKILLHFSMAALLLLMRFVFLDYKISPFRYDVFRYRVSARVPGHLKNGYAFVYMCEIPQKHSPPSHSPNIYAHIMNMWGDSLSYLLIYIRRSWASESLLCYFLSLGARP